MLLAKKIWGDRDLHDEEPSEEPPVASLSSVLALSFTYVFRSPFQEENLRVRFLNIEFIFDICQVGVIIIRTVVQSPLSYMVFIYAV